MHARIRRAPGTSRRLHFTLVQSSRARRQAPRARTSDAEPQTEGTATPDVKVSWLAENDSERASFEILWRETTDPSWQVYDLAASSGETVLKGVSTDNHFFAVRTVGKNGARSIAVPTEIERRPPPLPCAPKQ